MGDLLAVDAGGLPCPASGTGPGGGGALGCFGVALRRASCCSGTVAACPASGGRAAKYESVFTPGGADGQSPHVTDVKAW